MLARLFDFLFSCSVESNPNSHGMSWQTAVDPGIQHGSGWPGTCVNTACVFQAIGDLQGRVFCDDGHMWR